MLGEYAARQSPPSEKAVVPAKWKSTPHKSGRPQSGIGLEMVKLALEGHDRFELNLYEAEKGTVSYSYDTIRNLNELYPEHEFYFIIGADSLFSIESWKCPQSLLSDCTILAACRDEKDQSQVPGAD